MPPKKLKIETTAFPGPEKIDPEGDLILKVQSHQLLVSSKILVLASAWFKEFLRQNAYAEGVVTPDPTCPPIKIIEEEDFDNFRLICCLLHHHKSDQPGSVAQLLAFAKLSDFYGLHDALSVHFQGWLNLPIVHDSKLEDQKQLLWVAFLFRCAAQFQHLSHCVAYGLTEEELASWNEPPILASVKSDLYQMQIDIGIELEHAVQHAIENVRKSKDMYMYCSELESCNSCGMVFLDSPGARCNGCAHRSRSKITCTRGAKLQVIMDWMVTLDFWPLYVQRDKPYMNFEKFKSSNIPDVKGHKCVLASVWTKFFSDIQAVWKKYNALDLNDYVRCN